MDKLNLLKFFITVVDRGSFAAAASGLGLSPSTVSKAISRLEDDLKLILFYRSTRQLKLTSAGTDYVKTARYILAELEQCEEHLTASNRVPRGLLRLNLPMSYGRRYVLPLIAKFKSLYPDITLDITFDDAYVDMIEQGVDVCIRSGTLDDSSLVARQLSPIDFLICASPEYIKCHGSLCEENYDSHSWIRFRFRQTGRIMPIMVLDSGEQKNLDPGRQFIVDDGEALVELCSQGLGLTQIPHFIARDWIKKKEIVPLNHYYRPEGFGVWVIYAKREYLPEKIRVFVEFLQDNIRMAGETPFATWAEQYV